MLLACLFGGGQGFFGDVIAQLAGVLLLIVVLFNRESELNRASAMKKRLVYAFIAIVFIVPILQLFPWQSSGAYALKMQQDLMSAGVPVSDISLHKTYAPSAPCIFCCRLVRCLLHVCNSPANTAASVDGARCHCLDQHTLGFAQLAQGINSPLRLYAVTNTFEAVGFFCQSKSFRQSAGHVFAIGDCGHCMVVAFTF